MKKFRIIAALAAIAIPGSILTSCDEIKENERYIDMGEITAKRTVLLEEFTGQRCTNCPLAHDAIEAIESQYGDKFIAVSIHATSLADNENPGAKRQGLKTADGDPYAQKWGVSEIPVGIVNRKGGLSKLDSWQGLVRSAIDSDAPVDIQLLSSLDESGENINITTDIFSGDNVEGKLQLWVVESGISAPQSKPDGSVVMEYPHNNVYRGSVNGIWGEDVTLVTRETRTFSHSIAPKSHWNVDNLSIVAFVYTESEGVLQAAKCPVTKTIEE